jgi:hypothetical protein
VGTTSPSLYAKALNVVLRFHYACQGGTVLVVVKLALGSANSQKAALSSLPEKASVIESEGGEEGQVQWWCGLVGP